MYYQGSERSEREARGGMERGGEPSEESEECCFHISRSPPPTPSSLPFCSGVQFSRDPIREFNDQIKILIISFLYRQMHQPKVYE